MLPLIRPILEKDSKLTLLSSSDTSVFPVRWVTPTELQYGGVPT
jgi:hypothetical protein